MLYFKLNSMTKILKTFYICIYLTLKFALKNITTY